MTTLTFDVIAFRLEFPAFANTTDYPDSTLQGYWDVATCFISDQDYGVLNGKCRQHALNLMVAHLAALAGVIAQNNYKGVPSLSQAATIDKVQVTLTPPPLKSQWGWWLSLTGYGQQLYALLQAKSVAGLYVGGLPETSAFRRVNGIFY
jgi:hypothetical protein